MATVDIYLPVESTAEWIRALSIPHKEIQRLTFRPLKWLRFATFAVCGAKGHLSATQGGKVVDYENVLFENLADKYFYKPDDTYHMADHNVFDDECTARAATPQQLSFLDKICIRDGNCAITGTQSELCDAAHIIPRAKGNSYLSFVVRDRSSLYEKPLFSLEEDGDIDSIDNGILLRMDIHKYFSAAMIGFLKTPNFAMEPADVPRVEEGPIPDNRTTLQYMKVPIGDGNALPRDIRAEVQPPPSILLDFMYGAAVLKRWKCSNLHNILHKQLQADFCQNLAGNLNTIDNETEMELDSDLNNSNSSSKRQSDADLLEAMDDMLLLSMSLKGSTPQLVAESEKQSKEEELHSQEQSCEKVLQWLKFVPTVALK